jgi:hypothetical protein
MFTHMDLHSFVPQSSAVTATNTNCTMSFVRVQDGDDSDAPVVGNYCLTRVPPPITSQVNSIWVNCYQNFISFDFTSFHQGSSLFVRLQTTPLMLLGVGFRATYSILTQCRLTSIVLIYIKIYIYFKVSVQFYQLAGENLHLNTDRSAHLLILIHILFRRNVFGLFQLQLVCFC